MRLERLTNNKIKFFITTDDLSERNLSKEDIWEDSFKWQDLFQDMLEKINKEFDMEVQGSLAVEIYSLQAQEMIVIVTVNDEEEEDALSHLDDFIDMHIIVEENKDILFEFESFEHIIELAIRTVPLKMTGGTLYEADGRYYLYFKNDQLKQIEKKVALLAEYGKPSVKTIFSLHEYGKLLMNENALEMTNHYFK